MENVVIRKIEVKNIICKTALSSGNFCANPYVGCTHSCKYCYAVYMREFTNHCEKWGKFLDVKYWPRIANSGKYDSKEIFVGSATDPYLPEEKEFERTRELLFQLYGSFTKISIQTKSDLVVRDLDVLSSFRNVSVGFSINTIDENFKDEMDEAPSIERRIEAMKRIHESGIRTTCFIAPIFPEITDVKAIIERVSPFCNQIWLENLTLKGENKYVILNFIKERYPNLYPLYCNMFMRNDFSYWKILDREIESFSVRNGFSYVHGGNSWEHGKKTIINYFHY